MRERHKGIASLLAGLADGRNAGQALGGITASFACNRVALFPPRSTSTHLHADPTPISPMNGSLAILLSLLIGVATPVKAQSSIGKAVVTERDGMRIVVGRDSAFSSDVENAEILEIEVITLDELTQGVMVELQKLQPTDCARATMEKEQRYWSKARSTQCRAEGRSVGRKQRKQQELGCRRWAALARLEELLIRYDELALPDLPEPQQMEGPGQ
jgi:hypothetical protein